MEAKEWINNQPVDQNVNGKINWGNMPLLSQSVVPNNVHLEDARNLVAFSAMAEAMSSYGMSVPAHPAQLSTHMYEKFNYEMSRDAAGIAPLQVSNKLPPPEDLNKLKAALARAKHGLKPPNCNCEGPECPDYLELIGKEVQCTINDNSNIHHSFSHVNNLPAHKGNLLDLDQVPAIENILTHCSANPLPFSQSALSIAKEKNISLQTAIAIEALTQLSSALPQPLGEDPSTHCSRLQSISLPSQHQMVHTPSSDGTKSRVLPMCNNDMFTNKISQPYLDKKLLQMSHTQMLASWDENKKTDQQLSQYIMPDHNMLNTPGLFTTPMPIKKEFPKDWNTEVKSKINMWPVASNQCPSQNDPMSGLKQLLGEANDFMKSEFKQPEVFCSKVKNVNSNKDSPNQTLISDSSSDLYKMTDDQQLSQLLQENTFHDEMPAMLQQNLHHKRHLFQEETIAQSSLPEQQTWWRPKSENITKNQAEKPEKEKKKQVQSPGLPDPKDKTLEQLVEDKKDKLKETHSVSLPMLRIKVDGFEQTKNSEKRPDEIQVDQFLSENDVDHSLAPPLLTSQPNPKSLLQKELESNDEPDTQDMDAPRQCNGEDSQNLVSGNTNVSNYTPYLLNSPLNTNSNSKQQEIMTKQSNVDSLPNTNEMNSVDEKFQELIKEFEAEFGEDFSLVNHVLPSESSVGFGAKMVSYASSFPDTPKPINSSAIFSQSSFGNSSSSVQSSDYAQSTLSASQEASQRLFSAKSPKQIKIESSGALTVLSTNYFGPDESEDSETFFDGTPTKIDPFIPSLCGFFDSPLKYLDSPTKSLFDTPTKKGQSEFPTCDCVDQIVEKDEGPYYTHLGSGPTVASIRELMEGRYGEKGKAIRIEKVIYTGREGKSSHGCPIAKWVIRRENEEEKLLCLVRHRAGHHCENAVIIILIIAWEGIPRSLSDALYDELTNTITKYGNPTTRRCGLNDDRTCACQGVDPNTCGASFSFGCSWSMYFNGCKYARSKTPRKFRLVGENHEEEEGLKEHFQGLATKVAPLYKQLAPQAYQNQVSTEDVAIDCRLGQKDGRPFAGVTACMDFCAHAHKDQHNLHNGCTVVCTLTKEDNRTTGKIPDDEQLHVLPLYKMSNTDEFGSEENQNAKMKNGAIQVLSAFPREVRKLAEPAKSCRQRQLEAKKAAAERKKMSKDRLISPEKMKQETLNIQTVLQNTGVSNKDELTQLPVKPAIKVEPQNHYNNYKYNGNAVVESYSVLGNCRPSDPYSMNSVYSYHSYYAQPNLPSMNGFHSRFSLPTFGYYGFPNNHMFPQQYLNYGNTDPRTGAWLSCNMEKRPNRQSLHDNINHHYKNTDFSEQPAHAVPNEISHQRIFQGPKEYKSKTMPLSHRTTPVPLENPFAQNRTCFTRAIKQEPAELLSHAGAIQRDTGSTHNSGMPLINTSMSSHNADQEHLWESYKLSRKARIGNTWNMPTTNGHEILNNAIIQDKMNPSSVYPQATGLPNAHVQENEWNLIQQNSATMHDNESLLGKAWSSCKLNENGLVVPVSPMSSLQQKPWTHAQSTCGSIAKGNSVFQDNLWNSVRINERQTPTPSAGLHDKSWNSFTASAMDPRICSKNQISSIKTEINSGIRTGHHEKQWPPYSLGDIHDGFPKKNTKDEFDDEVWSDSEHNFLDENIGGVAVAPGHGSILIECARRELHATTPLKKPNRSHPARISLVFYQHKNLNQPTHGQGLWEAKMKHLEERAKQRQEEAARLGLQDDIKCLGKKRKWGGILIDEIILNEKKDIPTRQAMAVPTNSAVTVSSYAYSKVTGPYSRWK